MSFFAINTNILGICYVATKTTGFKTKLFLLYAHMWWKKLVLLMNEHLIFLIILLLSFSYNIFRWTKFWWKISYFVKLFHLWLLSKNIFFSLNKANFLRHFLIKISDILKYCKKISGYRNIFQKKDYCWLYYKMATEGNSMKKTHSSHKEHSEFNN